MVPNPSQQSYALCPNHPPSQSLGAKQQTRARMHPATQTQVTAITGSSRSAKSQAVTLVFLEPEKTLNPKGLKLPKP